MLLLAASVLLPVFMLKAMLALDSELSPVKMEIKHLCLCYFCLNALLLPQFDVKAARYWMKDKTVMFF